MRLLSTTRTIPEVNGIVRALIEEYTEILCYSDRL